MLDAAFNSEQFKCSRCKNSLSIAPIVIVDNENYCGRCSDAIYEKSSNPKIERQILYEQMAEHLKFTCCFESLGCTSILEWKHVEEHEKTCEFRLLECLFNLNKSSEMNICNWKGERQDYFQHIQEKHCQNVVALNEWKIWDTPKTQVLRIDFMRQILLLVLILIDNVYYFTLIGNSKEVPVQYTIEIQDETKRKSLAFTQFSTLLPFGFEDLKKYGINLNAMNLNQVYLSVYFGEKCQCNFECNAKLLPRCDVCNKIMTEPVFTCELDHKNCEICIKLQRNCRFSTECTNVCEKKLTENKYLQIQYQRGHYRCNNAGCFYHGNFLEIKSHLLFCRMNCCDIPEFSKLNTHYAVGPKRAFKFDNRHFVLMTSKSANSMECRLLVWTHLNIEYKFEVTFFNSSVKLLAFPIYPTHIDVVSSKLINRENSIIIPNTLINTDGTGDLTYKLNISKI